MNIGFRQTLIVRFWAICVGAVVAISGANAMDVEGLTTIKSSYGPGRRWIALKRR